MRINRLIWGGLWLLWGWISPAQAQWNHLGNLDQMQLNDARNQITVTAGASIVQISAIDEGIVRIRLAPDGKFGRDFSWAVVDLTPQATINATPVEDTDQRVVYASGSLLLQIDKQPCRITVMNQVKRVLVAQDDRKGMAWDGEQVAVWHEMPEWESYLGLGSKTGPLDKREGAWTNWTSDTYGFQSYTDPIYQAIPFFMIARDGQYAGILFDNPYRSYFDFGKSERDTYTFGAEGGELNYYVIAGPTPKEVLRRYTELTGRMPLPPKWALGYHQCRYSYFPDTRVLEVAKTFREKKIPADVIYLDIDYMNQYRVFTWHPEFYPHPEKLMSDLAALGFKVVTIVDPGIRNEPGYHIYDEGTERNAWVKNPDGTPYVGAVWPGKCVFPDYSNPAVREWWGGLYKMLLDAGVDGIWTDMNEPADFDGHKHTNPITVMHDNEEQPADHRAFHNVYGMQMARATYEGLQKLAPDLRPFVITRAAYAGVQRYTSSWTGDNTSSWDHLRLAVAMCLGKGISGQAFTGVDIGGFVGGAFPELYARWIQVGALFPFCRSHTGTENPDQEPWSFGPEVEKIARESIELRYRLLPYIYSTFWECSQSGTPVMRPVFFEFPDQTWYNGQSYNFMLGSDLYIYPIVEPGQKIHRHRLPPGLWFDWHTGEKIGGGEEAVVVPDAGARLLGDAVFGQRGVVSEKEMLNSLCPLPIYARGGAIIPTQSMVQNTGEKPQEPLILEIFPWGESTRTLYEDAGDGYGYQKDEYLLTTFHCRQEKDLITFTVDQPKGNFVPPQPVDRRGLLRFHGVERTVTDVLVDGQSLKDTTQSGRAFLYEPEKRLLTFPLTDRTQATRVEIKLASELPADAGTEPVSFDFGLVKTRHAWDSGFSAVTSDGQTTTLRMRGLGDPWIMGQPLWLNGQVVNQLKITIAVQDAKELIFKFGTWDEPWINEPRKIVIPLQADGQMHEYTVDLSKVSDGRWNTLITGYRIDFPKELPIASKIIIDEISFTKK
ncbi:MAG: hypothetical protein HJJLKODD_01928 [Phycisphaerae bacterium]|nr:hypothetical protein [Phycisphaerae bacterium]